MKVSFAHRSEPSEVLTMRRRGVDHTEILEAALAARDKAIREAYRKGLRDAQEQTEKFDV